VTFVVVLFVVLVIKAMIGRGRGSNLLLFSSVRCEGDNCCCCGWDENFRIDEAWANFETPGNATDSNKHSKDAMKRVIIVFVVVALGWGRTRKDGKVGMCENEEQRRQIEGRQAQRDACNRT